MARPLACTVCQTILEELRAAFAEASKSRRTADVGADAEAFVKMLEGSEEALQQLLVRHPFRAETTVPVDPPGMRSPRIQQALRKMMEHAVRTGHSALFYRR